MKLILRADDLGISEAVNYGIHKAITDGKITCVGLMPNMPYARHGYDLIKDLNFCVGQHSNICLGKPVCDPALIPSLVDENGEFYTSSIISKRKIDTINIKECEMELEAQLKRFREITGRNPDYFEGHFVFSMNYFQALENVAQRHGWLFMNPMNPEWSRQTGIYGLKMAKLDENGLYDPKKLFQDNLETMKKNETSILIFHPGYLDQYLLDHSSYTKIRTMECEFLCSDWLKEFIDKNQIECVQP